MDSEAARRAAAAEARRQKILARGAERLSRITVGAPLPSDPVNANQKPEVAVSTAAGGAVDSSGAAFDPSTSDNLESGIVILQSGGFQEASMFTDASTSSKPTLQQGGHVQGSIGRQSQQDDIAMQEMAHLDADQALHMLLNHLAGPIGMPYLTHLTQRQGSGLQDHASGDGIAAASSGRSAGTSGDVNSDRNLEAEGQTSRWTQKREPEATIPTITTTTTSSGRQDRHNPTSASIPTASAAAGGKGAGISSPGGGRSLGVLLALTTTLASLAGLVLGPQLSAAMEATRRIRCAVAMALSVALFSGVIEPGVHLGMPPIVALLVLQVALIAASRFLMLRGPAASRASRSSIGSLSKSISGEDPAAGAAAVAAGGAAAPGAVLPTPRFDWVTLVPGLRPLLDKLTSAGALVSGLYGDVAVFVVSYLVFDAWGQVTGHRVVLGTSA